VLIKLQTRVLRNNLRVGIKLKKEEMGLRPEDYFSSLVMDGEV
jgi:hypothetical protein